MKQLLYARHIPLMLFILFMTNTLEPTPYSALTFNGMFISSKCKHSYSSYSVIL